MKFYVVPLSKEQSRQAPPISQELLDRAEAALWLNALRPPIILFCNVIAGRFPGLDIGEDVFLLNDVAWSVCQGLHLNAIKTIEDSEITEKYGLLIGPASASCDEPRFE